MSLTTEDDLTFRRLAGHLYALGPRPVAEFIAALCKGDRPVTSEDIMFLLVQYSRLDAQTVERLGGRDFPPPPLHAVPPSGSA